LFIPFYPFGMPDMTISDTPAALGMRATGRTFLALWRRNSGADVHLSGDFRDARILYPVDLGIRIKPGKDGITVNFPKPNMGCILVV